ncbi:MAG: hypothetical protein SOW59_01345 [Corynebacterium sp.]|nr:hypothetical protein [Corynebacterium sp.]
MADSDSQWFYNPTTGGVSQGKESGWDERMGPYATEEEARNALAKAKERNQAADAAEKADDNWGKPASWEK